MTTDRDIDQTVASLTSKIGVERSTLLDRMDGITRQAAVGISRRVLLRGIIGAALLAGGGWMMPLEAFADDCTHCNGPCGSCVSATGSICCSSNGYCWTQMVCDCQPSCNCYATGCFFAYIVACPDGSASWGCSQWCWC